MDTIIWILRIYSHGFFLPKFGEEVPTSPLHSKYSKETLLCDQHRITCYWGDGSRGEGLSCVPSHWHDSFISQAQRERWPVLFLGAWQSNSFSVFTDRYLRPTQRGFGPRTHTGPRYFGWTLVPEWYLWASSWVTSSSFFSSYQILYFLPVNKVPFLNLSNNF